jgi:hypothetical protein
MKMVRKQFYITEEQDAALKRLAASMAVTEAEVVRMALDRLDDVTYVQNRTEDGARVRETAIMDRYTTNEKETADVMGSNLGWRLDAQAWQEEVAFMRSLAGSKDAGGREGTTDRFDRDEIYEERLAKILRRH